MLLKPQVLDRMITLNCLKPRLSISSAHAFLLVYSAVDPESVHYVKQRFEEIREQRTDFQVKNTVFNPKSPMSCNVPSGICY